MAKFTDDKEKYFFAENTIISLLQSLPSISLDPQVHNINYLPTEKIYYISKEFMSNFDIVKDIAVRDYKIINYGKPAVNLVFNTKHKYFLKKEVDNESIKAFFQIKVRSTELDLHKAETELHNLKNFSGTKEEKQNKKTALELFISESKDNISSYQDIVEHPDNYTFAVSNYELYYTYTVLTFKYHEPNTDKSFSEDAHIVKDFIRQGKTINEKANIIFVDLTAMEKSQPHQHKKIDSFLKSFDMRFESGVHHIYVKKNNLPSNQRYIENWSEFQKQFIDFLWQYKDSQRLRSGLIKAGKNIKLDLKSNNEFNDNFNYVCERLPIKIKEPFKKMFLQGYFFIGQKEINAIAQEQNREYLILLLFETLRHSHKENPLQEAKQVIKKSI